MMTAVDVLLWLLKAIIDDHLVVAAVKLSIDVLLTFLLHALDLWITA